MNTQDLQEAVERFQKECVSAGREVPYMMYVPEYGEYIITNPNYPYEP